VNVTKAVRRSPAECVGVLKVGADALTRAIIGAVLGATGAGLYGLLFGLMFGLLHANFEPVAATAAYLAACGAIAGGLVGGLSRIIDTASCAEDNRSAFRRIVTTIRTTRPHSVASESAWLASARVSPGCWSREPSSN
jgi:hypothetical protein